MNQLRDDTVCRNKKLNPTLLWTSSVTIQHQQTVEPKTFMNQLRAKSWTQNFYKPAPWRYSIDKRLNPNFLTQKLHFVTELEDAQDENSAILLRRLGRWELVGWKWMKRNCERDSLVWIKGNVYVSNVMGFRGGWVLYLNREGTLLYNCSIRSCWTLSPKP